MNDVNLNAMPGDIWIDAAGNEYEWQIAPVPGGALTAKHIKVNGKTPAPGSKAPSFILRAAPRADLTVFRGGHCIQDGALS